jgi:hypothetical protein
MKSNNRLRKKEGAPAWDRGPPKAAFLRFGLGVTEPWGIHPSFPLRCRSETTQTTQYVGPFLPTYRTMRIELERDPRLVSMQAEVPNCPLRENLRARLFNDLKQPVKHLRVRASSIRESTTRFEVCRGLVTIICAALFCAVPRDLQDAISVQE